MFLTAKDKKTERQLIDPSEVTGQGPPTTKQGAGSGDDKSGGK